jgi:hypothetical protein
MDCKHLQPPQFPRATARVQKIHVGRTAGPAAAGFKNNKGRREEYGQGMTVAVYECEDGYRIAAAGDYLSNTVKCYLGRWENDVEYVCIIEFCPSRPDVCPTLERRRITMNNGY